MACAVMFAGFGWSGRADDSSHESEPIEFLLEVEGFEKRWSHYADSSDAQFRNTWKLIKGPTPADTILTCTGMPYGYLRTRANYDNFEFSVEWKYTTDPNGNSGVLLYTDGEDKIWPNSIQVQLHRPTAGSIFPSGDAKSDNTLQIKVKEGELPVNQWHTCFITSNDGKVSVTMNGSKVGEITGCMPKRGNIALQSEGAEIHFRNMWIRPLTEPAMR